MILGRCYGDAAMRALTPHSSTLILALSLCLSSSIVSAQGPVAGQESQGRRHEDPLDYYHFAQKRSGNTASLMNKIGLIEIELRNIILAHGYFQAAVKLNRNDASGWNNL